MKKLKIELGKKWVRPNSTPNSDFFNVKFVCFLASFIHCFLFCSYKKIWKKPSVGEKWGGAWPQRGIREVINREIVWKAERKRNGK